MAGSSTTILGWSTGFPDGDVKLRPRAFKMEDGPGLLSSACLFASTLGAIVDDMLDASIEQGKPPAPVRPRVSALVAIPQAAILVT
jgi:hypothetical protein